MSDAFEQGVQHAVARWEMPTEAAHADVFSGVTPVPIGKPNPWVSGGSGTNEDQPVPRTVIQPPRAAEVRHRVAGFSPVKIGYLIDIDSGALLGDCLDAVILAAEDALNGREVFRPVEIVTKVARG